MMTIKKDSYTYEIEIVETMSAIIEVVAEDDSSAILKARERYRNEDIELNYDDLIDTKFNIFGVE
nr:DpnD/PcfM family protein [uncultured Psychrobacter sp.]